MKVRGSYRINAKSISNCLTVIYEMFKINSEEKIRYEYGDYNFQITDVFQAVEDEKFNDEFGECYRIQFFLDVKDLQKEKKLDLINLENIMFTKLNLC